MNSRRLIRSPRRRVPEPTPACRGRAPWPSLVDDQLIFGRRLHRKVPGLALEDAIYIARRARPCLSASLRKRPSLGEFDLLRTLDVWLARSPQSWPTRRHIILADGNLGEWELIRTRKDKEPQEQEEPRALAARRVFSLGSRPPSKSLVSRYGSPGHRSPDRRKSGHRNRTYS